MIEVCVLRTNVRGQLFWGSYPHFDVWVTPVYIYLRRSRTVSVRRGARYRCERGKTAWWVGLGAKFGACLVARVSGSDVRSDAQRCAGAVLYNYALSLIAMAQHCADGRALSCSPCGRLSYCSELASGCIRLVAQRGIFPVAQTRKSSVQSAKNCRNVFRR